MFLPLPMLHASLLLLNQNMTIFLEVKSEYRHQAIMLCLSFLGLLSISLRNIHVYNTILVNPYTGSVLHL
jgi:hypothetical protein